MSNLYDLYDGEEKIKQGLTAKDVKQFGNLSKKAKLNQYFNDGILLCGRYRVVVSGTVEASVIHAGEKLTEEERLKSEFIKRFGWDIYNQWHRMNQRYGGK